MNPKKELTSTLVGLQPWFPGGCFVLVTTNLETEKLDFQHFRFSRFRIEGCFWGWKHQPQK